MSDNIDRHWRFMRHFHRSPPGPTDTESVLSLSTLSANTVERPAPTASVAPRLSIDLEAGHAGPGLEGGIPLHEIPYQSVAPLVASPSAAHWPQNLPEHEHASLPDNGVCDRCLDTCFNVSSCCYFNSECERCCGMTYDQRTTVCESISGYLACCFCSTMGRAYWIVTTLMLLAIMLSISFTKSFESNEYTAPSSGEGYDLGGYGGDGIGPTYKVKSSYIVKRDDAAAAKEVEAGWTWTDVIIFALLFQFVIGLILKVIIEEIKWFFERRRDRREL